jgi:hypothetical protein
MREALASLNHRNEFTPCAGRPIPYEVRQSPEDAAELCSPCPIKELCKQFGYTEGVYADDMIYGGVLWKRGKPVVSET